MSLKSVQDKELHAKLVLSRPLKFGDPEQIEARRTLEKIAEWREDPDSHPEVGEHVCSECGGEGTITCPECDGEGVSYETPRIEAVPDLAQEKLFK